MYQQSLPPAEDSIASAGVWARGVATAERPELAEQAEQITRDLVAPAVLRTPAGKLIHAEITVLPNGLRIEVRDPGPAHLNGASEWAEVSSYTTSFGTYRGPDGHGAWADLRIAG